MRPLRLALSRLRHPLASTPTSPTTASCSSRSPATSWPTTSTLRRSRRRSWTTWWRPASCAWPPTAPAPTRAELRPRPPGGDRRRDRGPRLGRAGADRAMRPLPQPQVRSDPAARLLPLGGRLQGGLRRARLAEAVRARVAAPHGGRDSQAARPQRPVERSGSALLRKALDRQARAAPAEVPGSSLGQAARGPRTTCGGCSPRPPEKRDAVQKYLAEKFDKALRIDVTQLKEHRCRSSRRQPKFNARQMEPLQNRLLLGATIQALWDRGEPSPTYIYRRGDPPTAGAAGRPRRALGADRRQDAVRGEAAVARSEEDRPAAGARPLAGPARSSADRPRHGQSHLEAPLRPGHRRDAGQLRQDRRPAHASRSCSTGWPASSFDARLEHQGHAPADDDLRHLSAVLAGDAGSTRSSIPTTACLSRMPLRRMEAEVLYDSLLLVAGRLDETRFGPPDPVEVAADGLVTPTGTERGLAAQHLRAPAAARRFPTLLESFDLPQMNPNCIERRDSDGRAAGAAPDEQRPGPRAGRRHFAERVRKRSRRPTRPAQVERAYLIALSRPPTAGGARRSAGRRLASSTDTWAKDLASAHRPRRTSASRRALSNVLSHAAELGGVPLHRLSETRHAGIKQGSDAAGHAQRAASSTAWRSGTARGRPGLPAQPGRCSAASTCWRPAEPTAGSACRSATEAAAALRAEGQGGHPPVHERRAEPDGPVRSQAAARRGTTASRSSDEIAGECRAPQTAGGLMRSPFKFAQHGQCGMWVSDALPHLARQVDRHRPHPLDVHTRTSRTSRPCS